MSTLATVDARARQMGASSTRIAEDASIREFLRPLRLFLDQPAVTEVCLNRAGRVHVETAEGWMVADVPEMSAARCAALAQAIATYSTQGVGKSTPLLSADLPTEERIQIVLPPAVKGDVSLTIRRPSPRAFTLGNLAAQGLFNRVRDHSEELLEHERRLLDLQRERRFEDFLGLAMAHRLTIVTCGETGTGKTTLMRALLSEVPSAERIITIEDAHELRLPDHENRVHLIYSKGGQGAARVTAQDLIASSMRMRPDRVFLAEIRGAECFDFISLGLSGHEGSMTSLHAASPAAAFRRMAMLCMQSEQGRALPYAELSKLLHMVVDVVIQLVRPSNRRGRYVDQIYYDPRAKLRAARALTEGAAA